MSTKVWPSDPAFDLPELQSYRDLMPPWALPYWDEAVGKGNADAAEALNAALNDEKRAFLCTEFFYGAMVPLDVFRKFLAATWRHSHNHLLGLLRTHAWEYDGEPETPEGWMELEQNVTSTVVQMFQEAHFDIPEHLPEEFKVYRGTYGLPADVAQQGLSWSLSRHKAVWFAQRGPCCLGIYPRNEFNRDHGAKLLTATVKRSDVLMWTNDRSEQEIVARVTGPVVVEDADDQAGIVIFDGLEEYAAAKADPLLMDQKLQEAAATTRGKGFGK